MLTRLRHVLQLAAAEIGTLVLRIVEDDREPWPCTALADQRAIDDASRRAVVRYGAGLTDALMRLRHGHGLDEAARLDLEVGAERVSGFLTLSGRDPPP